MKVVMVNDCAYVGETLLKNLPATMEKTHIKRSRGLWSKTFGIAYKIMRTEADVYHVHYLLQDCYIASVLGKKPLVGHAHGSDLLNTLNRHALGRLVRSNLRKCDWVFVSTPDLLDIARLHRPDAEYLPNPVDMELFYPKPLRVSGGKLKVLIASGADWALKGTDIIVRALARLRDTVEVSMISYGGDIERTLVLAEGLGLGLNLLPPVPHEQLNQYYWNADIVIGQGRFRTGVLGLVSLEAIACGRPVLANVSSEYEVYRDFPLKNIDNEEKIADAIQSNLNELWKAQHEYLIKNHDPKKIAKHVLEIYQSLSN